MPSTPREDRKPYECPQLTVHGTVAEITQSAGFQCNDGSGLGTEQASKCV